VYYTNRAIVHLKQDNFKEAQEDCKAALRINPANVKAYHKLSKADIGLGELADASMNLSKALEFEPDNETNKKELKLLNDLRITEKVIYKNVEEKKFDKAVINLDELLKKCKHSINHICLKVECLLKSYQVSAAKKYSRSVMKESSEFADHPRLLFWRGKVLYYAGDEEQALKNFRQALNYDPDFSECQ